MSSSKSLEKTVSEKYYKASVNLLKSIEDKSRLEKESKQSLLMSEQYEAQHDNLNKIVQVEKKNCYDVLENLETIKVSNRSNLKSMILCYKAAVYYRESSIEEKYYNEFLRDALMYRWQFLKENPSFQSYFFSVVDDVMRMYNNAVIRRNDLVDLIVHYRKKEEYINEKIFIMERRSAMSLDVFISAYAKRYST